MNTKKDNSSLGTCMQDLREAVSILANRVTVPPVYGSELLVFQSSLDIIGDQIDYLQAVENLQSEHGEQHSEWAMASWVYDVRNGDTKLGYWDWVQHQIESEGHAKTKPYLVKLRMFIGSSEKTTRCVVTALSEYEAGKQALLDECHDAGDEEISEDGNGLSIKDLGGEMGYRVESVKELNGLDFQILSRHL